MAGKRRGRLVAALCASGHAVHVTAILKIDFVSDVSCPWCVIGLGELDRALSRLGAAHQVQIEFQPFELKPDMSIAGQDVAEHLAEKYGSTPDQLARVSEQIRARGAELGFDFRFDRRQRIFNTFDAHRLLYWTRSESGRQLALKRDLFKAYFTDGTDIADHAQLVRLAGEAGLDAAGAHDVLASGRYSDEVRAREKYYRDHGIQAVPSVIIQGRHLIQGAQPSEIFEQALRQLAATAAAR